MSLLSNPFYSARNGQTAQTNEMARNPLGSGGEYLT